MENVNYGDLEELEKLGETKNYDYTTEQLLDSSLKNVGGESAEEVRKRMISFFDEIMIDGDGKNIALISHGAAIKFFLQNFCEFSLDKGGFIYDGQVVVPTKIASPSIVKLIIKDRKILHIKYEE